MAKTLSGNIPNGYVLADATLNPITNLGTIALGTSSNAAALEGETVAAWTVLNQGTIDGGTGTGIDLLAGGTVTNDAGAWTGGIYGIAIQGVAGTVVNASTIDATSGSAGVFLTHGGSVTNDASGQILGGYGVKIQYGAGSVLNTGEITADTSSAAISLLDGGSVTNEPGGTLSGNWGISLQGSSIGTAVNAGVITGGAQSGVFLTGGTVINQAGGDISGNWAVAVLTAAGTVVNGGTMVGNGGTAVTLPAGYPNLVEVQPGAAFTGAVDGGNSIGASIASTLDLAAGAGTLAGIGGTITNFSSIVFDPGADWDVSGVLAGFGGAVSGFAPGDTIDLTDVLANSGTYASGELTLYDGTIQVGQIAITGSFPNNKFDVGPTTGITVACFAAGTHIATADGETPVETLAPGQRVRLAGGGTAPVRWLGHRRVACISHPEPAAVWPVRIAAGAFGDGRPHRDLLLSPDHAVYIDGEGAAPGVLIPIRCLLNGATIVQQQLAEVTYFHLELPTHAVILAEGLGCESYLDLGNRGSFDNGGAALLLHADFAARIWRRDACAELIFGGPKLAAARWSLIRAAARLGHVTSHDPAPGMRVGRTLLQPQPAGLGLRFLVPSGARSARLVSRTCIHAGRFDQDTSCRHGIAVAGLLLDRKAIDLADPSLGTGWHAPVPGLRWTDGDARIALNGAREILLMLAPSGPYWAEPRRLAARAA